MVRAVIFDLDNCLASAREPGEALFAPAFAAIRDANHGRLSPRALQAAFDDCWRLALDAVARKHDFSDEMLRAGWKVFERLEVGSSMRGYGDLDVLGELPARLFLVTSGFRRLQESKISALGLGRWMEEAYVDAIDEPDRPGKRGLFQRILRDCALAPAEAVAVGDNPESEIEAANRLGMRSVQILRPGVERGGNAAFHVRSLDELAGLLARMRG